MLRRLRWWLIKRLGGFTPHDTLRIKTEARNEALRRRRHTANIRDAEEFARYMGQYHDAGYTLGFRAGATAEKRAHSCEEARLEGFEDGFTYVTDAMDATADTMRLFVDRVVRYEDFRDAFMDLQNG